ncbi:MAG: type II toxin-antitoxin system prevent-host-death family antitoxin [Hellea sp.]
MQKMTAKEARHKLGQLLDRAQGGPVAITKHGHRVGVFVVDDCYRLAIFKPQHSLEESLKRASQDIEAGRIYSAGIVFAEIRENIPKWAGEEPRQ